jgi:putative endonuclease
MPCAVSPRVPSPSQSFGFIQERIAECALEACGYRIADRNWRGGRGEIDLVAWDGGVLCFVEVRARTRSDYGWPDETVDRKKQRKIIRAALAYLCQFPPKQLPMARFDVVSILEGEPTLIRNAFDCGRG